ncbi:MAG: hypothetical protein K6G17_08705 [Oscillospiraceae bacterium]|nr:hypothetical protein [Oscillospiraceae bacterium]
MKKIALLLAALTLALLLCACGECKHEWEKATCTEPQYCTKCGEERGSALGHDWVQVDENTRRCTRCRIKESVAPAAETAAETGAAAETAEETTARIDPAPAAETTPAPTPAEATPTPKPVVTHWYDEHLVKMKAQSDALEIPDDLYFLSAPEEKTILGSKGTCIYELYAPSKDAEKIGKIDNGTLVSVLARKNGFALFVTSGGLYAWGTNELIVDGNDTPYLVDGKHNNDGTTMVMSYKNKVYVYYDPYCVFPVLSTMDPGTWVTAYNTVNGFTYVETGSTKGWVSSNFFS